MVERVTIAGLQGQLEAVTKERDDARTAARAMEPDLAEAVASSARQADQLVAARRRIETLEGERDALSKSLRAYKGSATKAKNEALVLKKALSPESRAIGVLKAPLRGLSVAEAEAVARPERRAAFEAAIAAGPVEMVFSDGRKEIRELAPLIIGGDAWREDARGFTLKPEAHPLLEPGDMTRPEVVIAGVGLLDEAGEQFAWLPLIERVTVPKNGRVQLPAGTIRATF